MPYNDEWDAWSPLRSRLMAVGCSALESTKEMKVVVKEIEKMEYSKMSESTVMKINKMLNQTDGKAEIYIRGYKIPCHIDAIQTDSSLSPFGHSHDMRIVCKTRVSNIVKHGDYGCDIEKVIFSKPATIVFWTDGTKTVVKAGKKEKFDKEKGLAMAIAKKFFGNKGSYYKQFKKWTEE